MHFWQGKQPHHGAPRNVDTTRRRDKAMPTLLGTRMGAFGPTIDLVPLDVVEGGNAWCGSLSAAMRCPPCVLWSVMLHCDYPVSCLTSSASLKWRTFGTIATPHTTRSAPRPPVKAEASVLHKAATTPDSNCPSCGPPMVKMLFTAATRPRK